MTFTDGEIDTFAHLSRHFADYMFGDDREDHWMGILKQYRERNLEYIHTHHISDPDTRPQYLKDFLSAMGKFNRKHRKIRNLG